MNVSLFLVTVLIWGTTWIAIALQVGPVPAMVSVFYRFALAAVVFLLGLALLGRLRRPSLAQTPWIALQALCLFSFNFLCFYNAAAYLPSGVISVVFSLATLFNAVNARLFFGERISAKTVLAASMGIGGLALMFAGDLSMGGRSDIAFGLGLACAGTMLFSLGNMVSRRNSAAGITPIMANAWGMGIGALVLLAIILLTGTPVILPSELVYTGALVYLAVIGSVVGFTTYLMMVARMGSAKAAYATVMFPIVALALSTVFEGYTWNLLNSSGLFLALLGNVVMFARQRSKPSPTVATAEG